MNFELLSWATGWANRLCYWASSPGAHRHKN